MAATVVKNEPAITPKFSGHETFTMRHGWIKKAVDAVTDVPDFFRDEDSALVDLGVGKNMVRSIRHWATVTGIIEEVEADKKSRAKSYAPSQLGEFIFADDGADPYMEDSGTLWLAITFWLMGNNAQLRGIGCSTIILALSLQPIPS